MTENCRQGHKESNQTNKAQCYQNYRYSIILLIVKEYMCNRVMGATRITTFGNYEWSRVLNSPNAGYNANLFSYFKMIKIFKCNIVNNLFSINFNVCFGCSKEPSH